ncbi:MAG: sugar-binding domain-containing protein, partial [Chloroflexota bacterium]
MVCSPPGERLPIGYGQVVRARWAWAVLAACIAVAGLCRASSPNQPAGPISLAAGWQFARDPGNQGLRLGWQLPATAFPSQRTMATGQSLADQGIASYRGIAWFRRTVNVPDGWPQPVLGFGAVDVAADVYVNGRLAGHFEDQKLGARAAVVDLAGFAQPGSRVTLALRVVGTGGFGGIKQPVELGSAPRQVMTGKQYELYLHDQHPGWRMPGWTSGAPLA